MNQLADLRPRVGGDQGSQAWQVAQDRQPMASYRKFPAQLWVGYTEVCCNRHCPCCHDDLVVSAVPRRKYPRERRLDNNDSARAHLHSD